MKHLSALMMLWAALILTREPDAGELRLGQRVYIDNGSRPAAEALEVAGAKMAASGGERVRKCVPRNSAR